jgi:hypothetical protein
MMERDNIIECFAEMLLDYIDARLVGDLDEAFKIRRKITKNNVAESLICSVCKKVSNKGNVITGEKGRLVWECSRCSNMEIVRNNVLFSGRKEGN